MNASLAPAMAAAGLTPGQAPVPVLLPDPARVFAERARRLHELAPGHSLAPWLLFVARLSEAQQVAADALVATPLPAPENGIGEAWKTTLSGLLKRLSGEVPSAARSAMQALAVASDAELDGLAAAVTGLAPAPQQLAALPFVAAALQVHWTRLAADRGLGDKAQAVAGNLCPVCGSHPVAGQIMVAGEASGMRYLACGMCHTRWHYVRAKCTVCAADHPVEYRSIEGGDDQVRAETCTQCHAYLKVFFPGKQSSPEPTADDLASLALDLLLDEEGYQRAGVNLFMLAAG